MELDPLALQIKEHLRQFRPEEYRGLKTAGTLDASVSQRADQVMEALASLRQQNIPYNQAWEMVRDQGFPPSEDEEDEAERQAAYGNPSSHLAQLPPPSTT